MAERLGLREVLPGAWLHIAIACVVLALAPLPLGFVEEGIAVAAGVWGLYFVLPMATAVAGAALAIRLRPPRALVRTLVVLLGVVAVLHFLYWGLWLFPFSVLTLAPAAVFARAAVVAWLQ